MSELAKTRGQTDGEDRLLSADAALAALQERCGGDIPGVVAIPELLALVRKARGYGFRMSRRISAFDGEARVSMTAEVAPSGAGPEHGCEILLADWIQEAADASDVQLDTGQLDAIDRDLAEFVARLDPRQHVFAASSMAPDLQDLEKAMNEGAGQPWLQFVQIEAAQSVVSGSLHWRLLDGARCTIEGSARDWTVRLIPSGMRAGEPAGFELLLVADQPLAGEGPPANPHAASLPRLLGRELTPALRKPISSIIANAETIRTRLAGPLPDEYAGYAADISHAGKHLLSLLDDLADLEAIEAEDFQTAPDLVDLGDAARRAAGILGVKAQARGISITVPPEDKPCPAVGEFRRVLQILLNLIGNAINYSPEGSRIVIEVKPGKKQFAKVSVGDEGPGIGEEQQARLFEKFERLGREGDGGSGLGLYISRRLAVAMGGALKVESAAGEGARFNLMLPKP